MYGRNSGNLDKEYFYIGSSKTIDIVNEYYQFKIQLPQWARYQKYDFKVQYINQSNVKSPYISYIYDKYFTGSNLYVDGDDNLITGSVYIGNTLNSGIQMSGQNSAYIRSIGYQG